MISNKLSSNVTASELKQELENMVGKDNVSVSGSNKLKVRFLETQNEYVISNGTVEEYQKPEAPPM